MSGDTALAFCSDSADIRRFTRDPLAAAGVAGRIDTMDRVIPLTGDRAVGARRGTPGLVSISLGGGNVTWVDGPPLASRVTAMTVSLDQRTLFTARSLDAATSELASWRLDGDTITPIATQTIAGTVTALAARN